MRARTRALSAAARRAWSVFDQSFGGGGRRTARSGVCGWTVKDGRGGKARTVRYLSWFGESPEFWAESLLLEAESNSKTHANLRTQIFEVWGVIMHKRENRLITTDSRRPCVSGVTNEWMNEPGQILEREDGLHHREWLSHFASNNKEFTVLMLYCKDFIRTTTLGKSVPLTIFRLPLEEYVNGRRSMHVN